MPRIPKISRTITTTVVDALCLDIASQSAQEVTYVLPRTYKNDTVILKKLQKTYDTDDFKVNAVLRTRIETAKYAMSEPDFISHAHIINE